MKTKTIEKLRQAAQNLSNQNGGAYHSNPVPGSEDDKKNQIFHKYHNVYIDFSNQVHNGTFPDLDFPHVHVDEEKKVVARQLLKEAGL